MHPIQPSLSQAASQASSGSAQRLDAGPSRAPGGPAAGGAAGTAGAETVSISQSARQLLQGSALQAGAPASPQRLGALRQAIASGTYTVNTRQIAQGLLRDSRALGAAAGGGAGS